MGREGTGRKESVKKGEQRGRSLARRERGGEQGGRSLVSEEREGTGREESGEWGEGGTERNLVREVSSGERGSGRSLDIYLPPRN